MVFQKLKNFLLNKICKYAAVIFPHFISCQPYDPVTVNRGKVGSIERPASIESSVVCWRDPAQV